MKKYYVPIGAHMVCVCVCKVVIFSETTKGKALKDAEKSIPFCSPTIPLYIYTLHMACFCCSVLLLKETYGLVVTETSGFCEDDGKGSTIF